MLKVILVLQALCSSEGNLDCHINWNTNQVRQHVAITGYKGNEFTTCTILNAVDADCVSVGGEEE